MSESSESVLRITDLVWSVALAGPANPSFPEVSLACLAITETLMIDTELDLLLEVCLYFSHGAGCTRTGLSPLGGRDNLTLRPGGGPEAKICSTGPAKPHLSVFRDLCWLGRVVWPRSSNEPLRVGGVGEAGCAPIPDVASTSDPKLQSEEPVLRSRPCPSLSERRRAPGNPLGMTYGIAPEALTCHPDRWQKRLSKARLGVD